MKNNFFQARESICGSFDYHTFLTIIGKVLMYPNGLTAEISS